MTEPAAAVGSAVPSQPKDHPPTDSPASYLELGNSHLQKENYPAALAAYRKYLETHEDPEVLTSMAICLRQTGQVVEALSSLQRSLALKPNGLEALYYLGVIQQYDLADFEAAIGTYEQVLGSMPPQHRAELEQNVAYMKRVRENLGRHATPEAPAALSPETLAPAAVSASTPVP
jgi:tetratricopeptide (TPR) repeat protein